MDHHGTGLSDTERAIFDDLARAWSQGPSKQPWLVGVAGLAGGLVLVVLGLSFGRIGSWPVVSFAGWATMVGGGLAVHHWSAETIAAVVRRHADDILAGRASTRSGTSQTSTRRP